MVQLILFKNNKMRHQVGPIQSLSAYQNSQIPLTMAEFHVQNHVLASLLHNREIKFIFLFECFVIINKNLLFWCNDEAINAFAIDSLVIGVGFFVYDYSIGENEFSLVDREVLLSHFVSDAECGILGID